MPRWQRIRVVSNVNLQGHLCLRIIIYWFFCQLTVLLMLGCAIAWHDAPRSSAVWLQQLWSQCGPAILASLLMLPLVLLDCLIFSNKFTGPMGRLLTEMKNLADGSTVEPLRFRRGDFCGAFAIQFNRIRIRLQGLESFSRDWTQPDGSDDSVETVSSDSVIAAHAERS